uniref:PX domain-containing protein n=1 Tax=Globisporangium ultimum (strain ATCC 200006 / CBS 805.95 / DAOM BR144) TaxID=431595 RepID=K3WAW7_GLOUD
MAMASSPVASRAQSYAKYIQSAKPHSQHYHDQLRMSSSSTASTSSNSTILSDASSASFRSSSGGSSSSSSRRPHYEASTTRHARSTSSSACPHEALSFQHYDNQEQSLMEQDPDYLPIDSTQYKRAVTRKKKKRSRRIKLKLYGLAKQAAKMNNLSGFLLHSITPRESSILQYTSMATPGTHTEYDIVVENFRAGMIWQVSRRYSSFRLLRDELLKPFQVPHCHYCASIMRDMQKLEPHFPGKRLWGSTSPSVVKSRAERFQKYLRGLMSIATSTYTLNCKLVANYFVVQLRTFLTSESVRYSGIPGEFGQQIPSLLRELSVSRSPHDQMTLQTIQEHSSRGSRGSLFEDLDEADLRDFQEKLRLAEDELDRQFTDDATGNHDEQQDNQQAFEDYFREEDEDEDDDDDSDSDGEADGQDHQQQLRGRHYKL